MNVIASALCEAIPAREETASPKARSDTGAQMMAADSNVSVEMRELGRVLQRIMIGAALH